MAFAVDFRAAKPDPAPITRDEELRRIEAFVIDGKLRRFPPGTAEELLGAVKGFAVTAARARSRNRGTRQRALASVSAGKGRQAAAAEAIRL